MREPLEEGGGKMGAGKEGESGGGGERTRGISARALAKTPARC